MNCTICNGSGEKHWAHDNSVTKCYSCNGTGQFPELDTDAIIAALVTKQGKFRASFPKKLDHFRDAFGSRVYYVWRMARFHGGADVTMPMTAQMVVRGDPTVDALDKIADAVAKRVFGTDRAAMHRWGNLLGFAPPAPSGLPPAAYEGGPVTDSNKPAFEEIELK